MDKLSVYDAKAHFSELVELAESGRSTVITKRGRVVAKIVPAGPARYSTCRPTTRATSHSPSNCACPSPAGTAP